MSTVHGVGRLGAISTVLAAVLIFSWSFAAPAVAQTGDDQTGGAVAGGASLQVQDCDQVIVAAAEQYANGGAASIAQYLGVSVEGVQNCIQNAPGDLTDVQSARKGVMASTIPEGKVLPLTGGISAALPAGTAMVGAGLSLLLLGRTRGL